jgi:hypothetical protein
VTGAPLFGNTFHITIMQSDPPVPEGSQSPKKEGHQERPKPGRPPLFPEKSLPQTLSKEESDKQFQRNAQEARRHKEEYDKANPSQARPKGRQPLFPESLYDAKLTPKEASEQFLRNNRLSRAVRGAPVDPNESVY